MEWLKRDFASGLVVLLPILASLFAVHWLYVRIARVPVFNRIEPPILGVILSLVAFGTVVFSIGYLMRTALGTVLAMRLDALVNRIPGCRVLYNASKTAVETAVANDAVLQCAVKVKLWGDIRVTGFETGHETSDGQVIVFVPTAPNVTSGLVVEVDEADVIETDESVEAAMTRMVSAGFGDQKGNTRRAGTDTADGQSTADTTGDRSAAGD